MTCEELAAGIAQYFGLEQDSVLPTALLSEDLGFDSLDQFELLLMLEDLAGVLDESGQPIELKTVQDAFAYFDALRIGAL